MTPKRSIVRERDIARGRDAQQDPTRVRLKISGERNVEGELSAKGELEFQIADASKAAIHVDYREDDRLILGIRSSSGFKIGGKRKLKLDGGFDYDLADDEWVGDVEARLEFGKDVQVRIRQEFGSNGAATSVSVTVAF
jgi:hypothetical protein